MLNKAFKPNFRRICRICHTNCRLAQGWGCLCGHGEHCATCLDCTNAILRRQNGKPARVCPRCEGSGRI